MLIVEFNTEQEALECLSVVNSLAATWWEDQGYTVVDNGGNTELVGKVNGVDAPNNQHTTTWDKVRLSPANTYYFSSLSNNPVYSNWKDNLAALGFTAIGTEKQFPEAWNEEDNTE